MLEVMSILGSPYATNKLSDLDFYNKKDDIENTKQKIDNKIAKLKTEKDSW
jgi:hypothetical protein